MNRCIKLTWLLSITKQHNAAENEPPDRNKEIIGPLTANILQNMGIVFSGDFLKITVSY